MADAGTVTVRFSVKDGEAVREALERLGKDGESALKKLHAAADPKQNGGGTKALDVAIADLKGRVDGLAGSAGLAGRVLGAMGPVGIAVAVGVGLAGLAYAKAAEAAEKFAEKAKALKEASESAGLTASQFGQLSKVGSQVGVDFEQTERFINRLTQAIASLRSEGSGPLVEGLLKIDASLIKQVASAKDNAEAIAIVARAYSQLDDVWKRSEFIKSIAGQRAGLGPGRALEQFNLKGGFEGMEAAAKAAGTSIDDGLIKRVTQLQIDINNLKKAADTVWGRMFSEEILEATKKSAELWLKIMKGVEGAVGWLREYLNLGKQAGDQGGEGGGSPLKLTVTPKVRTGPTPEEIINDAAAMQRKISFLGAAATANEQYAATEKQVAAAVIKNTELQGLQGRVLQQAKFARDQAIAGAREALGVATEEEIAKTRLQRVDEAFSKGYIQNATERAAADRLAKKEAKDTAEAMAVRASMTPQLTRLALDSADLQKTLDQELSGALRGATSDLIAMAKGTVTLGQGLTNLTMRFGEAIAQAVLMKTVIGPLANVISGGLSTLFSADGNAFDGSGVVKSANGNAFLGSGMVSAFAAGGVFGGPTMFQFGGGRLGVLGEKEPEAVMPLRRLSNGRLGVESAGGGGRSVTVAPTFSIDARGATADMVPALMAQLRREVVPMIVPTVKEAIARGSL